MKQIRVNLDTRSYEIIIGSEVISNLGQALKELG